MVIIQAPKAVSYTIQTMKILLLVNMPNLTKKKHDIGVLKEATMILLFSIKTKNK